MRKTLTGTLSILFLLFIITSIAYSWGGATHAYIADQIGKKWGLKNQNEMYGASAPDIFNFMFGSPYMDYLYNQTHGKIPGEENFMKVWESAKLRGYQKSLAFGFVCHNDLWAADSTAHWMAQDTSPPEGFPPYLPSGYVIYKAVELERLLHNVFDAIGLGGEDYYPIRMELSHNLTEVAGDVFIVRADPFIGLKVFFSALLRDPGFPFLLGRAYARDFSEEFQIPYEEAFKIIVTQEREFRESTLLWGYMLMYDENTAISLIAEQSAYLMLEKLKGFGISNPALTPEIAKSLIEQAIQVALSYVIPNDYMTEIQATIDYVTEQLDIHGIFY